MNKFFLSFILLLIVPVTLNAGWLSGYSYRMSIPVANPSVQEDKLINFAMPISFLKTQGLITNTDYSDVHVTKSDGTTEIPCDAVPAQNTVKTTYLDMAVGISTLYVYYGNSEASMPTSSTQESGTSIDHGLEAGVAGESLPTGTWPSSGTPTVAAYNHDYPRGSTSFMELKITAQSGQYSGVSPAINVTDGGEVRFWLYLDSTTVFRQITFNTSGGANTAFIRFDDDGDISMYTEQSGFTGYTANSYNKIGSYTGSVWTQWRVTFNFTAHTWTLSSRTTQGGSWTQYKASLASNYNIPMRRNDSTSVATASISGYNGSSLWFDELVYSTSATMSDYDNNSTSAVQIIPPNDQQDSEEDTDHVYYLWGTPLEICRINSVSSNTYYGADTTGVVGISAAGSKSHLLVKAWEGLLPKGTVSDAKLYLYLNSTTTLEEDTTIKAFKMLSCTDTNTTRKDYVHSGWHKDSQYSRPTWISRYYDIRTEAYLDWDVAGVGSPQIDTSDSTAPDVTMDSATETVGYKYWDLPNAWVSAWINTEDHAQGLLLQDSADTAGSSDRLPNFNIGGSTNFPVLQVTYSALDAKQLTKRKLTSNTYQAATFPTQDRFITIPTSNGFAVACWVAADNKISIAYISSEGRMHLVGTGISNSVVGFSSNSPAWGINYDSTDNRFYLAGNENDEDHTFYLAYSAPYIPAGWTWTSPSITGTAKSCVSPKGGVAHCILFDSFNDQMSYVKYTRSSNTWSTPVTVVTSTKGGTYYSSTLVGAIDAATTMTGSGTIELTHSPDDFPAFGSIKIDSEYFWYTGISSATLTGVTRAVNSTAANHLEGATVSVDRGDTTYLSFSDDTTKECFHLTYAINSEDSTYWYQKVGYIRHYYADADNVWKDEANNTLTLPIDQRNERVISTSDRIAYGAVGTLCFENGDFIALYNEAIPQHSLAYVSNLVAARLANNGTTFTRTRLPYLSEASLTNISNGYCLVSGLHTSDTDNWTGQLICKNYGTLWDTTINTISIYDEEYVVPGGLWGSSCADTNNLGGFSLMYAQHPVYHGVIYLDLLKYTYGKLFWFH